MRKLSLLGCLLVLLVSCNSGPRLAETVECEIAAMDYLYDAGLTVTMDIPSDYWLSADQEQRPIYEGKEIVKYFGKIPGHILAPHSREDDNSDEAKDASDNFYASLRMLEDYVKGKTTEYPYESINQQICFLAHQDAMLNCEGYGHNEKMLSGINLVLTRYADLAFKYCPDITKFATQLSDDGNVGVMEVLSLGYTPIFSFVIFKSSDGVNFRVEHKDWVMPSRVTQFQHMDEDGHVHQYYLFDSDPNEDSSLKWAPALELYSCSDGGVPKRTELFIEFRDLASNWLSLNPSANPYYVEFFPEEYKWKFCKKDKKGYSPVPGMPSLCINFNPLCLEIVQ